MPSRVVVLVVLVEFIGGFSSIPVEQYPDTSSIGGKTEDSDQNKTTSAETYSSTESYNTYFTDYYMIPSDATEKKPFGGDRSDDFLYPPESYYKYWAWEEHEKDDMANDC